MHRIKTVCRKDTPAKVFITCEKCGSHDTGILTGGAFKDYGLTGLVRNRFCRSCNWLFKTVELSVESLEKVITMMEEKE